MTAWTSSQLGSFFCGTHSIPSFWILTLAISLNLFLDLNWSYKWSTAMGKWLNKAMTLGLWIGPLQGCISNDSLDRIYPWRFIVAVAKGLKSVFFKLSNFMMYRLPIPIIPQPPPSLNHKKPQQTELFESSCPLKLCFIPHETAYSPQFTIRIFL